MNDGISVAKHAAAKLGGLHGRQSRRRSGFFLLDVSLGLAIVAVLAMALITTEARQRRAARRLSDSRAAIRAAEETLVNLRAGHAPPADVAIVPVAGAENGPGRMWVEVRATVGDQTRSLAGLVPSAAVPNASTQPSATVPAPPTTQEAP